jgi:hypothetical protein
MPGGIIEPPYQWGTYIQVPGTPCWGFDMKLITLLCKNIIVAKSRKMKITEPNS